MNPHLSNDDLVRYLGGEETVRMRTHLDECPQCRAEASRIVSVIGTARSGVEAIGGGSDANLWLRQRNAIRHRIAVRPRKRPSWVLAAALAALLIVSAFMFRTQEPRTTVASSTATTQHGQQAVNDDALLSSVHQTLEQDVPQALAPLQQLAYEREQAEKKSTRQN